MISIKSDQIKTRADSWKSSIGSGEIIPGFSMVGGGSLPEESFSTYLLSMTVKNPEKFVKKTARVGNPDHRSD
jgi:hypothetical protein